MSRRKQDKLRDERLNSGPSTKLVSRGGKSRSGKSRSRKRSRSNGGIYSGNTQSQKPRNPYSIRQMAIMAIILIAFISGILMGSAYMFGGFEEQVTNPEPEYQNVTKNISQYHEAENVTYDINVTVNNTTIKNNTHIRNRTKMQ